MLLNRRAGKEYGIFRYAVLFSDIKGKLSAIAKEHPQNMRFDVIGHSYEGRELFLVTLASDVSDEAMRKVSEQRLNVLNNPAKALSALEKGGDCPPLPIAINCNLHGSEISGTDGMLTFIEEVLKSPEKERYFNESVILISICLNPDGRSRGLDVLNGGGVDLNRDWMSQTQPEVRALISGCQRKYYPTILVDMHGYMSSGNILIDACTPPHNPLVEYDLLSPHIIGNSAAMAKEIKKRTNIDSDIPAIIWEDGWDDYSPIYTTGYFMCNGAVTHTVELNFPSEEGAYVSHCAAIGMLDYVHEHKTELYKMQCFFYLRGVENKKDNDFHADYYIIKNDKKSAVIKTVRQLEFNGISVYINKNGDYVIPIAQPLRPLIHNMLWQGEDISDIIKNCYDISFYSYSVMRGLSVKKAYKGDPQAQGIKPVEETGDFFVSPTKSAASAKVPLRLLAVTDSGVIADILSEAGFTCDFLPFSELNTGFRIDSSKYDIMIVGGAKPFLWEDPFDEFLGVSYQNSWALRERGRQEVILAAGKFNKLILFGYSGMKVNEAIGRVPAKAYGQEEKTKEAGNTTDHYMFSASNGSFRMCLEQDSPLCKGYNREEVLYLAAPVAFESAGGDVAVKFAENSFINGFSKDKSGFNGKIAAFHHTEGKNKTVVFGFDPVFRGYTDVSFDMLFNAVSYVI